MDSFDTTAANNQEVARDNATLTREEMVANFFQP